MLRHSYIVSEQEEDKWKTFYAPLLCCEDAQDQAAQAHVGNRYSVEFSIHIGSLLFVHPCTRITNMLERAHSISHYFHPLFGAQSAAYYY